MNLLLIFVFISLFSFMEASFNCTLPCSTMSPVENCACQAVQSLQSYHALNSPSWLNSLWITGNGVETLTNYMDRKLPNYSKLMSIIDRITSFFSVSYLLQTDSGSYDDMLWWALAYMRLYQYTNSKSYLNDAIKIFDFIYTSAWDETHCNGGFWWSERKRYKNAITNELGIVSASKLYVLTGQQRFATIADKALSWFLASGMINQKHLINDGLDYNTCKNNNQTTWTYNQGVVLLGLSLAAERTGNTTFYNIADEIFNAVDSHLTDHGVLIEGARADGDGLEFKGIYVRYVKYVADAKKTPIAMKNKFKQFLKFQAQTMIENDRTNDNFFGFYWQGPIERKTAATQLVAIDLLSSI